MNHIPPGFQKCIDFMEPNKHQLAELMQQWGGDGPPFGVMLDMYNPASRSFARGLGKTDKELDDAIHYFEGEGEQPVFLAVISWEQARDMLPHMVDPDSSPSMTEMLDHVWQVCQETQQVAAVIMKGGGASFGVLNLDDFRTKAD
jgi:hypothetical protein